MKLFKIETGNFMLDGGAMFGVVPKSLWSKVYPADANNLCNLAMRCLLIEDGNRRIMIDAGIGKKQDEKFFGHYYLNGTDSLDTSLKKAGFSRESITEVILTHLHFDHCGGAVMTGKDQKPELTFPNATYWVSEHQWQWAMHPNRREKASYLNENFSLLSEQGKLKMVNKEGPFSENISVRFFNGHSNGLMIPYIRYLSGTLVFVSDLIPTAAHIPEAWVCGYDTRPLISMEERKNFFQEAIKNGYVLFFEHDLYVECCTLKSTEKGTRPDENFTLAEFLKRH